MEKEAAEIASRWKHALVTRAVPLADDFRGVSPISGSDHGFRNGLEAWIAKLGEIRSARFFVLRGGRLRYEIASSAGGQLNYRVGVWKQTWRGELLSEFEPIEETLTTSPRPLFRDITGETFGRSESFRKQLRRGVPYWRARLDSACGIDVYGNNGIAVGDIDGDGRDEVYICQPGGLPNRLYKLGENGWIEDITERWGVAVLDDSTAALFLDLRNSGRQDLVVLTNVGAASLPERWSPFAPPAGCVPV